MVSFIRSISFKLGRLLNKGLVEDIVTVSLEKAARGPICPLCSMEWRSHYIWLWSFLWESVNDPYTREDFISRGGLCQADSWAMVEVARTHIKSHLGIALVFEHLTKIITRTLSRTKKVSESWIDSGCYRFDLGQRCPACESGDESVQRGLERLLDALAAKSSPEWLKGAFPLCHRHIRMALRATSEEGLRAELGHLQSQGIRTLQKTEPESQHEAVSRAEWAIFPPGQQFSIPRESDRYHRGATERCPVCEARLREERDIQEYRYAEEGERPSGVLCLGHFVALSQEGFKWCHELKTEQLEKEGSFLSGMSTEQQANALLKEPTSCPLCGQLKEAEARIILENLARWRRGQIQDLLCLYHLSQALERLAGADRDQFRKGQGEKLEVLLRTLSDFIALHDYRSIKRPPEGPDSAYRWALRFLTSEPSLAAPYLSVAGADYFIPIRRGRRRKGK